MCCLATLSIKSVSAIANGPRLALVRRSNEQIGKLIARPNTWCTRNQGAKISLKAAGASQVDLKTLVKEKETSDRIETLVKEIKEIFRSMNDGETSPSAYDTAWVARIPSADDPNKPHFPTILDWILKNQQEDGSWGEPSIFLLYDRLVCTLSCVLALKTWKTGEELVEKGLNFLRTHVEDLEKQSESLITCGFEIAFPAMLNEAKILGIDFPYYLPCLQNIAKFREKKISRIPVQVMHSVHTTLLYTLEAFQEVVQWEKILKLQSADGSFLSSPSATAVVYMKTGDNKCLEFLTNVVNRFGDNVPTQYPIDLLERIWAIDTIQRLGIDHHFTKEIMDTLDYVYRNTGKQGASWGRDNPIPDIDDTCMALRLMRLHGYPVSSDVLEYFRDNDGNFICFPGQTHRGVSDMFNLYRFTQLAFPGEKILKEAKAFGQEYLRNCVENNDVDDKWSVKKALDKEVAHVLKNPWRRSFQRLEAREYIDHYGENDVWIAKTVYWMYYVNNAKYLELAKLDYNRLQNMYKKELNCILQWWSNCGVGEPSISPEEIHFSIAATLYEPQFVRSRMAYTKCNSIENVLKDLFENHGSVNDLELMCEAVDQWNPSLVASLPVGMKVAFKVMHDTLNELAGQASEAQGKDMFPYFHQLRMKQMQGYMKLREIRQGRSDISLEEYIEHGKIELGVGIRVLPTLFLMGERLKDLDLLYLNDQSWLQEQLSLFLRLFTDIQMYKSSSNKDKMSAISLCMKVENCTEEEAIRRLLVDMEGAFDEVVHETLKPSLVPRSCRRLLFEHARIVQFFLNDNLDNSMMQKKLINEAMDRFFTPI
ncbi:Bifunctional levopimaradiene synthase, chloroplastic [Canna indica]|uniref:Bifunctional levopimaradiene synthase, chloroplastic n=1 Tax=Canna indica TaxID=4628 RepID=A0AAQ3QT04_9LILI|nr:Bifunctional levopimaradiene synthase, chloroplastic [Canna indica]